MSYLYKILFELNIKICQFICNLISAFNNEFIYFSFTDYRHEGRLGISQGDSYLHHSTHQHPSKVKQIIFICICTIIIAVYRVYNVDMYSTKNNIEQKKRQVICIFVIYVYLS